MWLLNVKTLMLEVFHGSETPRYAILSHRWQTEELSFQDVTSRRLTRDTNVIKKLKGCCEQTLADGLLYVWIDTCCIDKTSSAELSEAINSMFQWYKQAEICYAYLYDVTCESGDDPYTVDFDHSVWFTRGWTLQELLAPRKLIFFDNDWTQLGSKADRWPQLQRRTRIPKAALLTFRHQVYTVADIFCWAAYRQTARAEDRAYSLFGLFDIQMPLLYGEGERALSRLNDELKKSTYDLNLVTYSNRPTKETIRLSPRPITTEKARNNPPGSRQFIPVSRSTSSRTSDDTYNEAYVDEWARDSSRPFRTTYTIDEQQDHHLPSAQSAGDVTTSDRDEMIKHIWTRD